MKRLPAAFAMFAAIALCADQATIERGRKEEARSCLPCHSLRLIHSQRLSRAAWSREVEKMIGWGSQVRDRDALLEYLVANFGEDKAPAPPPLTANGTHN